jgi:hypothetical protein
MKQAPKLTLIQGGKKEHNRFRIPAIIILIMVGITLMCLVRV